MKSKNDPLGMSALLSVMPDPIGHPSLTELLDKFLRLRIFLVIHPHHLLNSVSNPRTCLRMTFDSPRCGRAAAEEGLYSFEAIDQVLLFRRHFLRFLP